MRYSSREEVERIGGYGVSTVVDNLGVRSRCLSSFWLYTDPNDLGFTKHAINDGYWESWITAWMSQNVEPDWDCMDIGANHGYYTFFLEKHGCRVVAVEPQKNLVALMRNSAIANGSRNVWVNDFALSDSVGTLKFTVPVGHGMNATVTSRPMGETETMLVDCTTLDEYVDLDFDYKFLKIDVEGGEKALWDGAKKFREAYPDCLYLMEWRWDNFDDPESFANELLDTHSVTHVGYDTVEYPLETVEDFRARVAEDWMLVLRRKN